jgi:hypothetical protein
MLTYFWNILRPFSSFHGLLVVCGGFVYMCPIWYVVPRKSGNPAHNKTKNLATLHTTKQSVDLKY